MTASSRVIFDPKRQADLVSLPFDFISKLAVGETISTKVTTASVWSGVDPNPAAILSGAASSSGTVVSQNVTAGVVGVVYLLVCRITTSLGLSPSLAGFLTVLPDGP